jgi:hypothetical protein
MKAQGVMLKANGEEEHVAAGGNARLSRSGRNGRHSSLKGTNELKPPHFNYGVCVTFNSLTYAATVG